MWKLEQWNLDRILFIFFRTIGIEFIDSDIPYGYSVYFKRMIDFLKGLGYQDKINLYYYLYQLIFNMIESIRKIDLF